MGTNGTTRPQELHDETPEEAEERRLEPVLPTAADVDAIGAAACIAAQSEAIIGLAREFTAQRIELKSWKLDQSRTIHGLFQEGERTIALLQRAITSAEVTKQEKQMLLGRVAELRNDFERLAKLLTESDAKLAERLENVCSKLAADYAFLAGKVERASEARDKQMADVFEWKDSMLEKLEEVRSEVAQSNSAERAELHKLKAAQEIAKETKSTEKSKLRWGFVTAVFLGLCTLVAAAYGTYHAGHDAGVIEAK